MAIDFPNSPAVDDVFTVGSNSWVWNGTTWNVLRVPTGEPGPGVASGGTAGQVLSKIDANDYNTEWVDNDPTTSAATPTTLGTLYGKLDATTGAYDGNLGVGHKVLLDVTTGTANTAFGSQALENVTEGTGNIAIGGEALSSITTGSANIGIGTLALTGAAPTVLQNIGIGFSALTGATGNFNIAIGDEAGVSTSGNNNIAIGDGASALSESNQIILGNAFNSRLIINGLKIDWQHVISEETTIIASAPGSTTNYELMSDRSVRYHTVNANANWILNLRGNDVTAYDDISTIGKSTTVVFMATNGATAYYPTAFRIDGTSRTVKWQGGTAPSSGNANSIDVYTYTIIKTAVNTYTVLGSQTRFA